MAELKWIKLALKMFDDEKIRLIEAMPEADTILIIWVKLLLLAGKTNDNGDVYLNKNISYTDEMLATIFNRSLITVRLALETLTKFEMIEYDENGIIYISNWDKHQNIESMDRIREQTNQRVAKYREKQKAVKSDDIDNANRVDVNDSKNKNGNVSCNVTVTQCNATEEERRKKREESREKKEEVVEVEEVGIEKNEKEKFKTTTADISNELNNLPCERDLSFLENNVPKAFEFYEENFIKPIGKITIPQAIANNLIQAIETMGDDLVLFALQKTLEMGNNRDWAYIKKILEAWYKKGIRTVEQAINEQKPVNKNRKDMTVEEKANSINWNELEG